MVNKYAFQPDPTTNKFACECTVCAPLKVEPKPTTRTSTRTSTRTAITTTTTLPQCPVPKCISDGSALYSSRADGVAWKSIPTERVSISLQSAADVYYWQQFYGGSSQITGSFKVYEGHPMYHTQANLLKIFGNVDTIHGDLSVYGSSYITRLSFLPKLTCVTRDMTIAHNDRLQSLKGMNEAFAVGGDFAIFANSKLADLGGVWTSSLYVNGNMYITHNDALIAIRTKRVQVNGEINVKDNKLLAQIGTLLEIGTSTMLGGELGCIPATPARVDLLSPHSVSRTDLCKLSLACKHDGMECGVDFNGMSSACAVLPAGNVVDPNSIPCRARGLTSHSSVITFFFSRFLFNIFVIFTHQNLRVEKAKHFQPDLFRAKRQW